MRKGYQATEISDKIYKSADLVDCECLDCKKIFKRRFNRIKPDGNRCQRCAAKKKNRIYTPMTKEQKTKLSASHKGKPGYWTGKKYSPEHRAKLSVAKKGKPSWNKGKHRIDPALRKLREAIHDCCSSMVRRVLKIKDEKKVRKTFDYLGYTKSEFVAHIEAQFSEGMSWFNYGEWHVDHIVPVAHFVRNDILDVRIINALDNLQPLWKIDNFRKGDKLPESR